MMTQKIKNILKIALLLFVVGTAFGATSLTSAALPPDETPDCYGSSSSRTPPKVAVNDPNCIAIDDTTIHTDTNTPLIKKYLNPLVVLLSILVGLSVTFGIIYGAIQYSMSEGDPQKASNGKKHIRSAAIALVAYVLIFAFLNFIIPGGIAG